MNGKTEHKVGGPLIGLAVLGLVPAVIILIFLRLENGQMIIADQAISEYGLARLTAGLWSIMTPMFLLTPPALAFWRDPGRPAFWVMPPCVPWILTGPSLIAGWIVGGGPPWHLLPALLVLGLMLLCWVLWMAVLNAVVDFRTGLLIYGALWAGSGFIGYLHEYVVPNLDLGVSGLITVLYWSLPGLQNGFGILDNYLAAGELRIIVLGPTLVQTAVLAVTLLFLKKRGAFSEKATRD